MCIVYEINNKLIKIYLQLNRNLKNNMYTGNKRGFPKGSWWLLESSFFYGYLSPSTKWRINHYAEVI
jgi:hypothetical protein